MGTLGMGVHVRSVCLATCLPRSKRKASWIAPVCAGYITDRKQKIHVWSQTNTVCYFIPTAIAMWKTLHLWDGSYILPSTSKNLQSRQLFQLLLH